MTAAGNLTMGKWYYQSGFATVLSLGDDLHSGLVVSDSDPDSPWTPGCVFQGFRPPTTPFFDLPGEEWK